MPHWHSLVFQADASLQHIGFFTSYGAGTGMTDFAEPGTDEKTESLKRDFENRAFIGDFSQSVNQLAAFVSNFGTSSAMYFLSGRQACDHSLGFNAL